MERPHLRKRPFSRTREVSVEEEKAIQPTTAPTASPSSRPRKLPRPSEESFQTASAEQTSDASSYGAAPERRWVRCAYFTRVRTVKGVAVAWQTKTSFEPVGKMPQVFEAELSEESTIGSAPSLANTESLVSTQEPWQEGPKTPTQESSIQGEEAHTSQSSAQGEEYMERSRAATPEWMVTCKRGFRCIACCRVFKTLEALWMHAEHGVSQGFSCRVFYEEVLEKRLPPSVQHRPRRCQQLARRSLLATKKREVKEKKAVCRRLEEQLQKQREELKRLRQELEMLQGQETRLQRVAQRRGQRGKRLKTSNTWASKEQALGVGNMSPDISYHQ